MEVCRKWKATPEFPVLPITCMFETRSQYNLRLKPINLQRAYKHLKKRVGNGGQNQWRVVVSATGPTSITFTAEIK